MLLHYHSAVVKVLADCASCKNTDRSAGGFIQKLNCVLNMTTVRKTTIMIVRFCILEKIVIALWHNS